METFSNFWSSAVDIAWGMPLVILLILAGAYFTLMGRFVPFRQLRHAIGILRGKYDNPDDPG
ncbi:MAG: sodium:alanine symporter family protein, partial [candidate division Zixibacteria bacterium]|nr:sodium:alanine symporter family protein [candidate division Zixibacteria bacterium]